MLGFEAEARWLKKGGPVSSWLLGSLPESADKDLQLGGLRGCDDQVSASPPRAALLVESAVDPASAAIAGQIDIVPTTCGVFLGVRMPAPANPFVVDAAANMTSAPSVFTTGTFAPLEAPLSGREGSSVVTDDHRAAAAELRDCLEQQDSAHQLRVRLRATLLPVLEVCMLLFLLWNCFRTSRSG